ncbi:sigma-70 family RNA polymerase sigma factor [Sporosarcina sp. PTS2304]|uniref:RNA polymerase sigma factor n=1 Tax=Sporosarcina sp. PTS2304 TaxID=2283194 RepID=UPI000E0D4D17|nr:sigma-70 family RNA polymerase sigma factor [Sporosarcina sp. PTS2304]AXI00940.1 sigma-70 family RNA polymerase sigma factor [Sporosarcina sp. PTS2304]
MDNEVRWIKKIKRTGNESAANALVSKYYKEVYAYLYKQTLDNELSLDLTQEIFISVLKSIKRYDSKKAAFRTWLYKIASNRLVDYYRSKSYRYAQIEEPLEEVDIEDTYDVTISLEYKEDYEKVTSIVNELEASSQQIMRLKLFGEYTFQEIAAIEDMPLSTVKTKYYTSLRRIRKTMKEGSHD